MVQTLANLGLLIEALSRLKLCFRGTLHVRLVNLWQRCLMILLSLAQLIHVLLGSFAQVLHVEVSTLLLLIEYTLVLHVDLTNALLCHTTLAFCPLGSVASHLVLFRLLGLL